MLAVAPARRGQLLATMKALQKAKQSAEAATGYAATSAKAAATSASAAADAVSESARRRARAAHDAYLSENLKASSPLTSTVWYAVKHPASRVATPSVVLVLNLYSSRAEVQRDGSRRRRGRDVDIPR